MSMATSVQFGIEMPQVVLQDGACHAHFQVKPHYIIIIQ